MPLERFLGRVAILTGSTQGIGLATARRLGQEGCKVVVSSRRQENVDDAVKSLTKEGIDACGITANQRIKEDRQKLLKFASEKFGGFDHVFISAGVNPHHGSLLTVTEEQFDRTFDTNLKSNFQFIQECVPYMEKRGGGSIVTNSTAGVYGVNSAVIGEDLQLYSWSKLCLVAMTQQVAFSLYDKNIRVNCVAPGMIVTAFTKGINQECLERYLNLLDIDGEKDLRARIGLATARRVGQEGCKVVVSSRRQENVDDAVKSLTKDGIDACGITANQRIKEDRQKLLKFASEKFGGFDHVLINAGVNPHHGSLLTVTEEQFDRVFDTNLKSNFQFIQECVPYMEKRGGGSIVTNSTAGVDGLNRAIIGKDLQLYLWSKFCLLGMTQQIAFFLYEKNIRVNCVAPSVIKTQFSQGINPEFLKKYFNYLDIDEEDLRVRFGTADEVASVVAFLLSEDSSYVIGNTIFPAGGYILGKSV